MPKRRDTRTTIGLWLVGDLVAAGLDLAQAKQAAVLVLRATRKDLLHAADALDVDPMLGRAARVLALRTAYALERLGDPEQRKRT